MIAFSPIERITLQNGKKSVSAKAIGVAGDFFLFHPLKLLDGSFFSGSDVMQDYVVIDEDMAWQLFGSNDVAGKARLQYALQAMSESGKARKKRLRPHCISSVVMLGFLL